ncbi:MAG TPA: nucleotidyltransferase family protein [Dongiaceae bacterium]|nr:nucleotidyltransferase family protein [Dongiaceae bacterium]
MLNAAMCRDKAVAAAALDAWWANITDFDQVRGTDANLFPQVYWNLGASIRDRTLHARLKGTARHHWIKNQFLVASCGMLLDILDRAQVPVLLLKGAAIASSIDDDPGLRAMSDCDLLVPRDRALEVVDLLARANLLTPGMAGPRDVDVAHGITLALRGNRHAAVDLHWRPLRAVGADELARDMFAAARPVDFAGRSCRVPCPEHLVFHAIVHGLEWSPFPRYDWLIDTIKILRRTAAAFDWDRLVDTALRYRFGFAVGRALENARDKAGLEFPGAALQRLRQPLAVLQRLECRIRLSRPAARSVPDELLLALQDIRRRSLVQSQRSAWQAIPILAASMLGSFGGSRTFIQNDRGEPITYLQGWSAPEAAGRWTEGKLASCALYAANGTRPASLSFRGKPFAHHATAAHVVTVFAGWRRLGTLRWRKSGAGPFAQQILLPPSIWRGETAVLRFKCRRPISPIETGFNGDTRALGVFVTHISVDPVLRDPAAKPLDLARGSADLDVLWHGWSRPEAQGCWSEGSTAVLRWRAARDMEPGSSLQIEIADVAANAQGISGRLFVNDRPGRPFSAPPSTKELTLSVPISAHYPAGQEIEVRFEIETPARRRKEGLQVRRISLTPAPNSSPT